MKDIDPSIHVGQIDCISLEIGPNDFLTCEAGIVIFLDSGFTMKSMLVDNARRAGFVDSVVKYCKLLVSGDFGAKQSFFNIESCRRKLVMVAPYPCKIGSIDLDQYGGNVISQ